MAKDIIGIDISDASIEAIVLDKKRDTWVTASYSRFRLSPEIVTNGRIAKPNKLKEALLTLFKNAQPRAMLPGKVFLSIPESRVFTKVLSLPKNIKDKDLLGAAQHKAEEYIPESTENLLAAIQKLGSNSQQEFLYVGAERGIVFDLIKIFKELDIEVIGLTSEAISSWSGLHDKFKKNTTLLLDIGAKTTIASIYDSHSLRDSINIKIAGDNIMSALEQRFNISYAQAEEKIRDIGLTSTVGDGEVMMIIQGQLQPLIDEIKRFVQYYQNNSSQKIEQVVLIGGLAQMLGITNYFADNLSLPTFIGESFLADPKSGQVAFTKYINALGLASLVYEKAEINFMSEATKQLATSQSNQSDVVDNVSPTTEDGVTTDTVATSPPASGKFDKLKKIFSNIYLLIALILVFLSGAAWLTRSHWSGLFMLQKTFHFDNQTIVVGSSNHPEIKNFIIGQPVFFDLNQQRDFPQFTFQQVRDAIIQDLEQQVLAGLNKEYAKENNYIIPQILDLKIISTNPSEEEFKPGQALTLQANFKFLAVSKEDIKQKLLQSLSNKEMQTMSAWSITKIDYKLINFDPVNNLTTIEVNLVLNK